jgi:hypothetical protein
VSSICTRKGQVKLHYATRAYGGVDVQIYIFLTSALVIGEWAASSPGRFSPAERSPRGTPWIGGWVEDMEKRKSFTLPGLKLRPLVVQPAASSYTDCTNMAPYIHPYTNKFRCKLQYRQDGIATLSNGLTSVHA